MFLFSSILLAQDTTERGGTARTDAVQQPQTPVQASPPRPGDALAQMRDDLNKMDSLNLNMSSEIEFLHDQNLQILLRTNSQMWGILIRDLQRQLARQERQEATAPPVKK
jgi:hypothetical protein